MLSNYEPKIQNGNLYLECGKILKFCEKTCVEAIKNVAAYHLKLSKKTEKAG